MMIQALAHPAHGYNEGHPYEDVGQFIYFNGGVPGSKIQEQMPACHVNKVPNQELFAR